MFVNLITAATEGDLTKVKQILEQDKQIVSAGKSDVQNQSALYQAVAGGHQHIVSYLLE